MHRTTVRFWKCFENLPEPVQKISKKNFELLKINPLYPSLGRGLTPPLISVVRLRKIIKETRNGKNTPND